MKKNLGLIAAAIVIVLIAIALALVSYYVDWLWFKEVGYTSVFLTIIVASTGIGVVSALIFFLFVGLNLLITRRLAPKYWHVSEQPALETIRQFFRKAALWVILALSSFLAIFAGLAVSSQYETVLKFFNSSSFGSRDAVFNLDIGFYIFKLPFYHFIFGWISVLLVTAAIAVLTVYVFDGSIEIRPAGVRLLPHVKAHLSVLLSFFLVNIAFSYRLQMFDLLYSPRGIISGAGYTDIHANLPVLWILFSVAIISAVITLINIKFKGWLYPAVGIGILLATSLVAGSIYPAFIESYRVKPNQFKAETPFIKLNIKATRKAYSLDKVRQVAFKLDNKLTKTDVEASKATIENIRLWDWRPLLTTYRQIQEIRPYYVFNDIDVDRYEIDGKKRQVALSVRELSTEKLQDKAKTWVNKHMVFTHGYGVAMNAVNEVGNEGLPKFLIKDLPPASASKDLKISQPRIYFGELSEGSSDYAIVNTDNAEFDYPAGDKNITSHYKGLGGFVLNNFFKKLVLAYNQNDINILISSAIKPKSRIMIRRNIKERVKQIAPFILFDRDPYPVIDRGRLFWVIDGYTKTSNYPYSESFNNQYNYLRNSVKAVVDAYNGKVDFYTIGDDPIIRTYSKIFPRMFKPLLRMSKGLKKHLHYPEDLFSLQSNVYATYHMTDPQVFYNKEDKWSIPQEVYESKEQTVEPYYVILQLAQSKNDFQLIRPFTPSGKNNMISWMSVNSEPNKYGEVLLYQFSKKKLVYGPSQIEARIDQEPDISERFSLWSQRGSRVLRGNLLVIPIKNSLLFVEPIYLQSEQSEIPELKRVIVVFGKKVAMGNTFNEALDAIFSGKTQVSAEKLVKAKTGQSKAELVKRASNLYQKAIDAQKKGDWAKYGDYIKQLGDVLQKLQ